MGLTGVLRRGGRRELVPLAGKQLMPREIASYGHPHWHGDNLVKMVATALGESLGYVGAWNDNLAGEDTLSRDCGLMEISIPADLIGTDVEASLRTVSMVAGEWGPVVVANVQAAYRLWSNPGPNDGKRRWQPWVAYTTGWATFPYWWTWKHDMDHVPVGPWHQTGRYLQKAIVGVANYHLVIAKDRNEPQALALANLHAEHFGVEGTLGIQKGIVGWTKVPQKPSAPPEDGHGPRPVENQGA